MSDPITMGPSELQAYANGRADEKAAAAFVCKYRNSGVGGNDAQECAWPQCGCDPAANRVLEHIQECGFVIVRESDVTTLRELLAQAAPGTGPDEVWDKRRREALADTK